MNGEFEAFGERLQHLQGPMQMELGAPPNYIPNNVDFIEIREPVDQLIGAVDGAADFAMGALLGFMGVDSSAIQARSEVYAIVPVDEVLEKDEEIGVDLPMAEVVEIEEPRGLSQEAAHAVLEATYDIDAANEQFALAA